MICWNFWWPFKFSLQIFCLKAASNSQITLLLSMDSHCSTVSIFQILYFRPQCYDDPMKEVLNVEKGSKNLFLSKSLYKFAKLSPKFLQFDLVGLCWCPLNHQKTCCHLWVFVYSWSTTRLISVTASNESSKSTELYLWWITWLVKYFQFQITFEWVFEYPLLDSYWINFMKNDCDSKKV